MATFIKAGFWDKLCKPCKGYKGWLNLDEFIQSFIPKPTYKVFTALLTQSGGEYLQYYDEGSIKIGETYLIRANVAGKLGEGDFTNVGAPNNLVGTHFIATGTTPNSWGTFSELELNTGAPVATILENTIGDIWFVYETPGIYSCQSINLFTQNKTYSTPYNFFEKELLYNNCVRTKWVDATKINILTTGIGLNAHNDGLESTAFEIRVYN